MSENKYTPEPWRAFNNGQGVVGVSTDRSDVCWTRIADGSWLDSDKTIDADYENARRIVACVNACTGIDTELLEIIADNDKTLAGVIANVEKQRDELLAALKSISKITGDAGFNIGGPLEHCPGEIDHDEAKRLLILACEYLKDTSKAAHRAIARAKGEQ